MLSQALEDNSSGWSIDTHGKCLGGEQHLDKAPAKQHLYHFFHDG